MRFSKLSLSLAVSLIAGLCGPGLQAAPRSNQLVRVPQDARTLDLAIGRVADGGVIEMAAGTYPSPPGGFRIGNLRKGLTVRAAAGATVAIDGGGSRKLLRFVNSDRARGKRVAFQRITFQNGYSADVNQSGGVTLGNAEALFQRCSFLDNRAAATQTGGGAVEVLPGSSARFVNSSFRSNSSPLRGGAMEVRSSDVTIQGGDLTGNRTNLPGHHPGSIGGAVTVVDGTLSVSGTRFEGNEAGWLGGAIYAIGTWSLGSSVQVADSTFVRNRAAADPCCVNPEPTSGGAIHAEDLTTLRIQGSLLAQNQADYGGGVDSYRADVGIQGSVFQANGGPLGGGAISSLSIDWADGSTANGTINRRSARLVIDRSLLQGGGASGGGLVAGGDRSRGCGGGGERRLHRGERRQYPGLWRRRRPPGRHAGREPHAGGGPQHRLLGLRCGGPQRRLRRRPVGAPGRPRPGGFDDRRLRRPGPRRGGRGSGVAAGFERPDRPLHLRPRYRGQVGRRAVPERLDTPDGRLPLLRRRRGARRPRGAGRLARRGPLQHPAGRSGSSHQRRRRGVEFVLRGQ